MYFRTKLKEIYRDAKTSRSVSAKMEKFLLLQGTFHHKNIKKSSRNCQNQFCQESEKESENSAATNQNAKSEKGNLKMLGKFWEFLLSLDPHHPGFSRGLEDGTMRF